jgi:hypothetical protein
MQQIMSLRKSYFVTADVRHVKPPRYAELTVSTLYRLCAEDLQVMAHLPDWDRLNRKQQPEKEFVWKIISTLRPEFARKLLERAYQQREEARLESLAGKNIIEICPRFLKMLADTQLTRGKLAIVFLTLILLVVTKPGKSTCLIDISKRKAPVASRKRAYNVDSRIEDDDDFRKLVRAKRFKEAANVQMDSEDVQS